MHHLLICLLVYFVVMTAIVYSKPDFVYDHDEDKYREFGTGEGKTLATLPVLGFGLAIVFYLLFLRYKRHRMGRMSYVN